MATAKKAKISERADALHRELKAASDLQAAMHARRFSAEAASILAELAHAVDALYAPRKRGGKRAK